MKARICLLSWENGSLLLTYISTYFHPWKTKWYGLNLFFPHNTRSWDCVSSENVENVLSKLSWIAICHTLCHYSFRPKRWESKITFLLRHRLTCAPTSTAVPEVSWLRHLSHTQNIKSTNQNRCFLLLWKSIFVYLRSSSRCIKQRRDSYTRIFVQMNSWKFFIHFEVLLFRRLIIIPCCLQFS